MENFTLCAAVLESKDIGFLFEPELSISNHRRFYHDIVVMEMMLWSETCLTGKIVTLVFGASVEIAPQ